jgi:hypothetical protein
MRPLNGPDHADVIANTGKRHLFRYHSDLEGAVDEMLARPKVGCRCDADAPHSFFRSIYQAIAVDLDRSTHVKTRP